MARPRAYPEAHDIPDIDRIRLRQEAVEQVGVFGRLHADREAEILACLFGDLRDRGDRRPGMAQYDILDVLRPDRRKPGQRAGPRREPAQRRPALQEAAASDAARWVR